MRITFVLLVILLALNSCSTDDENLLNYDGSNVTAPLLEPGFHQTCAYFPSSMTDPFLGRDLISLEYYILEIPSSTIVSVHDGGDGLTPGIPLYSANLSSSTLGNSWNTHLISNPVTIDSDIWICVEVEHPVQMGSVGCDAGPANQNGDYILSSSTNTWMTLREKTSNNVNINWNIRGEVSEQ